ncbi:thioredoxin domain-containing protein [Pseudoalteromonas denitrificans]|uniref:Protein-disulfide isomerase n=1 Tax=Pseudoalteromonas denitrificans DSM 6059 TaxID=1123010 RepID=A0A1I1N5A2_9GAMM|nr:thioredoxin domain-containing protein [Pseudoalteromonas denitrificans]SFC89973.1 Protein-disulfide isomerase [Pseudoalteromonas denitrificans DSM 6059]
MTKFFSFFVFIAAISLLGCSDPQSQNEINQSKQSTYEEDKHYRIVENINFGDLKPPFLIEYFWLGCPHCQNFEKPLQKFKSENPNIGFIRKHAVLSENWANDARIFYALQETNNMAHFSELFELYKAGIDQEGFESFFVKNKIDKTQFLEVAGKSENVLNNMNESYEEMTENKITSVPSVVVNGKYLVIASEDTDNNEKYFKLVKYLLKKP